MSAVSFKIMISKVWCAVLGLYHGNTRTLAKTKIFPEDQDTEWWVVLLVNSGTLWNRW